MGNLKLGSAERAVNYEKLADDYERRAGETDRMIELHPNAPEVTRWRNGAKRDRVEARKFRQRASNARAS